jgi:hypothetical protein
VKSIVEGSRKYNRVPQTTNEFYTFKHQIGKGAFGEV